jgi:hypothetical protein
MGFDGLSLNAGLNYFQHPFHVLEHFVVPEAQHDIPGLFQKSGSFAVISGSVRVLPAVKLDHDFSFQANEIQNVVTERVLAPEFAVFDLPLTQTLPESGFRLGRGIAQCA